MTVPAETSPDTCLAVRRVGRTTMVQLCDLTCPERLALMSAKYWVDWKDEVAHGLYTPESDGAQVIITIQDRAVSKALQHVYTSALAYEVFKEAARMGRFDGLSPVPANQPHGPWVWAGGVLDDEQVKALNGAA
ncbi:hypothetical protein [Nonomuraea candida]|uniref:hypothetical protein n=1 Tax=Nonomuraea candida TaxID=359159 RepID=UPI0005BC7F45|nr:hypothetical protein [Nonomuraea candida]